MKQTTLLLLLLAGGFMNTYAQADSTGINFKKHEIKIGAIKLLAGGIVEGTYEYIHSPYFTYGASILGNFDKSNEYPEDFSVTPFARFYFTESKEYGAKGFFVEGFAKFLTGRQYVYHYGSYDPTGEYIYNDYESEEKFTTAAAGLSLGWKWINNAGFVLEIHAGAGRNFGGDNVPDATFRGDLNLGYRF